MASITATGKYRAIGARAYAARPRLRFLTLTGLGMALLCLGLFVLLQSKTLWESPTLVQDKWKAIFYPIRALFPTEWAYSRRGGPVEVLNAALLLLMIAAFFGLYIAVVMRSLRAGRQVARDRAGTLRRVLWLTGTVLLVLLVLPASFSKDLYNYIWYGRILAVYGDNPFVNLPSQYVWSDTAKWIQWTYWVDTSSVYGPVWVWMAAGIASVAQMIDGNIVTHLLGNKLLTSAAHLVNIILLWKTASIVVPRFWTRPASAEMQTPDAWHAGAVLAITLTYAWNPLALLEFGANGHNDVLMLTGLLAALWLHLTGRWRLAVLAIALASLVKAIALVFLPGYLWLLFWETRGEGKQRLLTGSARIAQSLGIVMLAWVVGYLPFWTGPEMMNSITGGPATSWYVNSIGSVIRFKVPDFISQLAWDGRWRPYAFWTPDAIGWRLDWPVRWGLLAITATVALLQTWKARTFPTMVNAWGWTLFAYLTLGSVWYWPWYASWLLVPVALLGPGRLFKATLILCATGLAYYAIVPRPGSVFHFMDGWTGALIGLPPLLFVLGSVAWDALQRRRDRTDQRQTERDAVPAVELGLEAGAGK
jgi:hypothetical protein